MSRGYILDFERQAHNAREQWHSHKHECHLCFNAENEREACAEGSKLFKSYERLMIKLGNAQR